MAINWNLMTQGVDLTGFGQGIAQGIRMATERKVQEERMFDSEWKEFSRMFDPSKISDSDREAYIQAYQETHKVAKALNRAEKGGSTELVNQLDVRLQKAQSQMASIYGKSKMKNEKVLLINKEIERLQKAGYNIPLEYKEYRNKLANTPITALTDDDLEGDFKLDVDPTFKQLSEARKTFDASKDTFVKSNLKEEEIDIPGVGKAKISKYTPGMASSPEEIAMNVESIKRQTINNYGVSKMKWLKQSLSMPDGTREKEDALTFANNLVTKAKLNSINDIQDVHITADGLGMYDVKQSAKEVVDTSDVANKMKQFSALNAIQKNKISEGFLRVAQERASTDKQAASDFRLYAFVLKNGASPLVKNSPGLKKMLNEAGIDEVKLFNDIDTYKNKGQMTYEDALLEAISNQKAQPND